MPNTPSPRQPKLRHHKASGQGFVELNGQRIYLGVFGRPDTIQKYHQVLSDFLANGRTLPVPPSQLTITELVARFWTHCTEYYRHPDGTNTDEVASFRLALRPLKTIYGSSLVSDLGPRRWMAIRQHWIAQELRRTYINHRANRIGHAFKRRVEILPMGKPTTDRELARPAI